MVLPTTYASALLLLLVSFFCLGMWPSTFKGSGSQWRFELFYFDFAFGALLLSVIAAFTFGTFGSEMAFSDRMLVAGHSAEAWAAAAGFLFNIGNMLLLAAISLVGVSAAFLLSIGLALAIESFYNFRADNIFFLVGGVVLILLALVSDGAACRLRDFVPAKPVPRVAPKPSPQHASKKKARRTTKGIILGLLSAIPFGLFHPVFTKSVAGDFGLGAYAGVLLFCVGMMLSTIIFNFYFMNIAIEGGAIKFSSYFRGGPRQHFLGFGGGAIWTIGALAAALAASAPSDVGTSAELRLFLPVGSAVLAVLTGLFLWKEFPARTRNARISIGLATVFFAAGLVLMGTGLTR